MCKKKVPQEFERHALSLEEDHQSPSLVVVPRTLSLREEWGTVRLLPGVRKFGLPVPVHLSSVPIILQMQRPVREAVPFAMTPPAWNSRTQLLGNSSDTNHMLRNVAAGKEVRRIFDNGEPFLEGHLEGALLGL